jgi:ABC-type multidrug transport system ATPase subunit
MNEMSEAAVVVHDVSHRYGHGEGSLLVLDGISMDVPTGTVIGLLGSNGTGKTTLIELVAGLRRLQSGDIRVLGRPHDDKSVRHHLGFLPQHTALYTEVSVLDNLQFTARLHGCPARRIDEVLELVGMTDRRTSIVANLSGGLQRRVAIARALLNEPDVLILDEPTLGVDSENRHLIWQHVRSLRRAGKSILITTNYLDEAEALCDEVVVLRAGHIATREAPRDLVRRSGCWLEVDCNENDVAAMTRAARAHGANEVIEEMPSLRMHFPTTTTAQQALRELLPIGPISAVRERRADLAEIFSQLAVGQE